MKKQLDPCICGSFDHTSHPTVTPENQRHTPTPWMVGPEYYENPKGDMKAGYVGSFARTARSVFRHAKPEDAAFIVRAVNSHDELLAALLKLHPQNSHSSNVDHENLDIESCEICQTIAKAEGGK